MDTLVNTTTNLGKLSEICVLNGARIVSAYNREEDDLNGSRDVEFYFFKPEIDEFKSRVYTWTINGTKPLTIEQLMVMVKKADMAFDLPFDVRDNLNLDARIDYCKQKVLNGFANDLNLEKSLLDNKMEKATDENWITKVYGEQRVALEQDADESLAFRKFDYNRTSLKEVLASKIIEAERLHAESFAPNSSCKEVIAKAYPSLLADIAEIEKTAQAQLSSQSEKGE